MGEETNDVRLARVEERTNFLMLGHEKTEVMVNDLRKDIGYIKQRLERIDVKQILVTTIFLGLVNGLLLLAIKQLGS